MADKIRDYTKLAQDIIELTGGEENISSVTHCATRLRLVLANTPEEANKKISALPGVVSVVEKGGQFQVVIGTHVTDVYAAVAQQLNLDSKTSEETAAPKQGIFASIPPDNILRCDYPVVYMLMLRCMFFNDVITPGLHTDHHDGSPMFPAPVYACQNTLKYNAPGLLRRDHMHVLVKIRIDNAFPGHP